MKFILALSANERFDTVFEGATRRSFAYPGREFDPDLGMQRQIQEATIYEVEDCDIQAAVDSVSAWHPSKEVYVVNVERVFQRMPGTLVEKKLSESGKLPI